jgi:site-specific recombinase XerD
MKNNPEFPAMLEAFFTDRLMRQRQASPHTIASYRDTFRLLLKFAKEKLQKNPSKLTIKDLNATFIASFLDNREKIHGNSARTRNTRLAAIHSFFRYLDSIGICICWLVMHIDGCQSVLSIAKQVKKSDRGAGATVSPVQMGRNGRDRRI